MKFGQLIEFNLRNILPQKLCRKWDKEEDQFPISFCLFFNIALYEVKASGYHLSFNIFWTYNRNKLYETSGCWYRDNINFDFLKMGLELVSPPRFVHDFSRKILFCYTLCLTAITSWSIWQYVHWNCLLSSLWRHNFQNLP